MPELIEFNYEVRAQVTFTRKEYEFLIASAKTHYDGTCKAAGLAIGEQGAQENGFLAQLRLFPTDKAFTRVTWPFSRFDLCMKILEPTTATLRAKVHVAKKGTRSALAVLEAQLAIAVGLTNDMWLITTRMTAEGKRLSEEAQRMHLQEPDGAPDQLWRLRAG
jgi:hypothetical protein